MTVKVIQDFWKNAIVFNESARGKGENLQGCWVVPLNPVEQARPALLPQGEKG
jgi:hypothetical protein